MSTEQEMGYTVVLAQNFSGGRGFNIQFNFQRGAAIEDWNAELDKFMSVFDRQAARAELPQIRKELKAQELVAEVIAGDIDKLSKRQTMKTNNLDPSLRNQQTGAQEAAAIAGQKDALEAAKRRAEELRKIIADLEKKAA